MSARSLEAILDVMAAASVGDLGRRVPISEESGDESELTTLAHALNILLSDLEYRSRRLAESERRFRAAFQEAPIGVVLTSPEGRFLEANEAFCDIVGYSAEELRDLCWTQITHPDDLDASHERVLDMLHGPQPFVDFEKRYLRKDGRILWAHVRSRVVRAQTGEPLQFVTHVQDMTREKETRDELRDLQQRLAASEKLSALGSLVSGVAHEIRTPLAYINNNVFLIQSCLERAGREGRVDPRTSQEVSPLVRSASEGVDRVNELVRGLRKFTRMEPARRVPMSLHQPVADAAQLFRATHRGSVRVVVDLAPTRAVLLDSNQIQQVVLNLLQNAVEVTPTGGSVRVRTRAVEGGAELLVDDDGPGIPEPIRARLFEPLLTTKPEGTGLGLSIVKRIVGAHGGEVVWQAREPRGTRFCVRLPVQAHA